MHSQGLYWRAYKNCCVVNLNCCVYIWYIYLLTVSLFLSDSLSPSPSPHLLVCDLCTRVCIEIERPFNPSRVNSPMFPTHQGVVFRVVSQIIVVDPHMHHSLHWSRLICRRRAWRTHLLSRRISWLQAVYGSEIAGGLTPSWKPVSPFCGTRSQAVNINLHAKNFFQPKRAMVSRA